MSEEKMCYLQRNGKTTGPFPKEKLEASLKEGTLKATDLVSMSQDGPWKAIFAINAVLWFLDVRSSFTRRRREWE